MAKKKVVEKSRCNISKKQFEELVEHYLSMKDESSVLEKRIREIVLAIGTKDTDDCDYNGRTVLYKGYIISAWKEDPEFPEDDCLSFEPISSSDIVNMTPEGEV